MFVLSQFASAELLPAVCLVCFMNVVFSIETRCFVCSMNVVIPIERGVFSIELKLTKAEMQK